MVGLKARQKIPAACDISVPVPPLAAALNDAYLSSRCANCFGALPLLPDSIPCTGICQGALVYCSVLCCQFDLEMHQKSGECYILGLVFKACCKGDASKYEGNYEHFTHFHGPDEKCRSQAEIFPPWNGSVSFSELGGTCDLRLALRLLRRQQVLGLLPPLSCNLFKDENRIGGLLSNRIKLLEPLKLNLEKQFISEEDDLDKEDLKLAIQLNEASRLMALAQYNAKCIENMTGIVNATADWMEIEVMEEALCQVVTNGVQIQLDIIIQPDEGMDKQKYMLAFLDGQVKHSKLSLGVAVYGPIFSWLNHSCRPNACYRFEFVRNEVHALRKQNLLFMEEDWDLRPDSNTKMSASMLFPTCNVLGSPPGSPWVVVRSLCDVAIGEEITIAYTDLLQQKSSRQRDLWRKYKFKCHCERCAGIIPSYADTVLEASGYHYTDSRIHSQELAEVSVFQERLEQLAEKVEYGSLLFAHNDDSNNCTSLIEDGLQGLVGLQVRTLDKNYVVPQIPFMHRTCLDAYMVLASTYLIHAERTSSSDIAAEEETAHVVNCGFKGAAAYALLLAVIVQHLFDSGDLGLAIILGHIWLDAAENTLRWIARMTFGSSPLEVCDSKDRLHLEECEPINFVWSMLKSHSTFLELVAEPTDFGQYLENLNKGGMCSTINKSSSTSGTLIREKLLRFVQDSLIHSKSLLHFCHGKNYVLEGHINALYFGLLGETA